MQVQHLIRDGYDKKKKALTCYVACINKCMDLSKASCKWYIHPDFPQLLLVVSIRSIEADEQLYILYGPDYWCQDRFPIAVLLAAVLGYRYWCRQYPRIEKTQVVQRTSKGFSWSSGQETVNLNGYHFSVANNSHFIRVTTIGQMSSKVTIWWEWSKTDRYRTMQLWIQYWVAQTGQR